MGHPELNKWNTFFFFDIMGMFIIYFKVKLLASQIHLIMDLHVYVYIYIYIVYTNIHARNYHVLKMFVNSLAHDADFKGLHFCWFIIHLAFFPFFIEWFLPNCLCILQRLTVKGKVEKFWALPGLPFQLVQLAKSDLNSVNHTHVYLRLMSPCNIQELKMRKRKTSKGELNFCCVVLKRITLSVQFSSVA